MEINFILSIIILLLSVALHEVSHGYVADRLGDPTAKLAGRLTLNPLKHLDMVGSIVVPTITFLVGGLIIGWAKPVPYNPYNLRDQRWGEAKVAFAGPLSNLIIALVFGLAIRFDLASTSLLMPITLIVFINIILAIFNLMPIPPLDGSKILFSFLPYRYLNFRVFLERYSLFLIIFFVFFLWQFLLPLTTFLFYIMTGLAI